MRKIMMQCTIEHLHKLNPHIVKELESGEPFEVLGDENTGFYYSWNEVEDDKPYRKLLDGTKAEELEKPMSLDVYTKCPGKWILQDIETGEVYKGTKNTEPMTQWKLISKINNKK
jgi:hypothetical protein